MSCLELFVTRTDADVEVGAEEEDDDTTEEEDGGVRWEGGSLPSPDIPTRPPPPRPGVASWLRPPEVLLLLEL